MPTTFDLIVAGLIAVGHPIWDYLLWPRMLQTIRSGRPNPRVPVYGALISQMWIMAIVIASLWLRADRPGSALGFTWPNSWCLGLTGGLVVVLLALHVQQTRTLARLSAERRERLRSSNSSMIALIPHTRVEYAWFQVVSVSAGICEELIYRGFLVWAFQPWLTLWGAALLSVISFGFAHAYQGRHGAVSAGVVGAMFAALAMLTGSIVPGMLLHALMDHLGSRAYYPILRDSQA